MIVNFCPTGMLPRRSDSPYVPLDTSEIVDQVHEACELGITIVHLHAREPNGMPSWRPESYGPIFDGVRRHCPDLVLCASTSGRNVPDFEKRSAVIELRPDMCSLTLSSLNFSGSASVNEPETIRALARKMTAFGVRPELECFDLGMINFGKYLLRKGEIAEPCYWNLIFGNIAGAQSTLSQMGACLAELPDRHFVAFGGIGSAQLVANSVAISTGLGVRVGLEDNLYLDPDRTKLATNLDLLRRIHTLREMNGRSFMTAREFGEHGFYNPQRHPRA